jgi:HK97 family phage prohead protease
METAIVDVAFKKAKEYAVKSSLAGLHIKDVDTVGRIVTGFYNTANYFDSDQDVILPGATKRSIAAMGPESDGVAKIKHLMFHDWKQLPGKIQTLQEKSMPVNGQNVLGLYFETAMAKTQLGTDTLANYQAGVYDNHSIGFQYLDGEYIDSESEGWDKALQNLINPDDAEGAGYMFLWKEIKLYEGSTVAFGANELTPYLGIKSDMPESTMILQIQQRIKNISDVLKNGTQSDDMMYCLQMQLKQLSQMLNEIFQPSSSIKDALKKTRPESLPAAAENLSLQEALRHQFFQS